jgi:hypothetical protein
MIAWLSTQMQQHGFVFSPFSLAATGCRSNPPISAMSKLFIQLIARPRLTGYRPQVVGTLYRVAELQKALNEEDTFEPSDNPWFKCLDRAHL